MSSRETDHLSWWSSLRHGGMLVDPTRLSKLLASSKEPLNSFELDRLRRRIVSFEEEQNTGRGKFVSYVLDSICGFGRAGTWHRGTAVDPSLWSRRTLSGEEVKPDHLWLGPRGATLPVFIDSEKRVGLGRGKRLVTAAIQWLRAGDEKLALVTNGYQWRLVMAGLDYEAFCEWETERWLESGQASDELVGLRALFDPEIWTPPEGETSGDGSASPFLEAIAESRKGQADLSAMLGERVRQAVEILVEAHSPLLDELQRSSDTDTTITPSNDDIYRAGVRLIMRLVVGLFAESREGLLPKDNPIFHECYSLSGLRDQLERVSPAKRAASYSAYPRIISLFRLIHDGSSHEALLVTGYGGSLFAPGKPDSDEGVSRALHVLEQGCYAQDVISDAHVYSILDLLSRTKVKIRQGRGGTWVPSPVDFSTLDSEYIGILYEGLLDFELRVAGEESPVVFLAVGNQPALPLSTLEAMDDRALKNLLEKMKDTSSGSDDEEAEASEDDDASDEGDESSELTGDADDEEPEDVAEDSDDSPADDSGDDVRATARTAAEDWARRAIDVGRLVTRPRGRMTPEKQLQYQATIDRKARQIITKVVLPGERYLVRWGGTRKGSGTFYTRPQLAVPTVHRTLRPLAYDPPASPETAAPTVEAAGVDAITTDAAQSGASDNGWQISDVPLSRWIPKRPEEILALKICDPACGSGSFPLAALRFLTDALYHSLVHHDRFRDYEDRTVIDLIRDEDNETTLADETLPCRPEDTDFESRTKAVLRRYVVERCIYGVDLDPLAVELCRLSLWIETLDRRLQFTFLNHKIRCGNSLVGTWFDQFMHYPAMAWMRDGGDKSHSNGVHYEKDAWTKEIKAKVKDVKEELKEYVDGALYLFTDEDLGDVQTVHDDAEQALKKIHAFGIHETEARAREYRRLLQSEAYRAAKFSLNQWCAIWFWPPEEIDHCPGVTDFYEGKLSDRGREVVKHVAERLHFFHWQLEFPDVFAGGGGFDAVLGNPPWDIAKPNSKEFFSAHDPLYRSYGKQAANSIQKELFASTDNVERDWLLYNADFRALSNWLKYSGQPFGNGTSTGSGGKQTHDLNLGDRGRRSFETSQHRHEKWKDNREALTGYSMSLEDVRGFRHQGGGDLNLYKMFLETMLSLRSSHGRIGVILPSSVHNDEGSFALRNIFIRDLELLVKFDNEARIFSGLEHNSKFDILVIGDRRDATGFSAAFFSWKDARVLEELERHSIELPLDFIKSVSPTTLSIPEIRTLDDQHVLERIYRNGEVLGERFSPVSEFHLTNDLRFFAPDDEMPVYQGAMIWHHDHRYNMFDPGTKKWRRGKLEPVDLRRSYFVRPQRYTNRLAYQSKFGERRCLNGLPLYAWYRIAYRIQSSRSNQRTFVATIIPPGCSTGNSLNTITLSSPSELALSLAFFLSFAHDFNCRTKISSNINNFYLSQFAFPHEDSMSLPIRKELIKNTLSLVCTTDIFSALYQRVHEEASLSGDAELTCRFSALTKHERMRVRCINDCLIFHAFGFTETHVKHVVDEFRGVDRKENAEIRQPALTVVAFSNLRHFIAESDTVEQAIKAFLTQNDGEGWQLPETLRLSDYGLGHDDRAKEHQPVRECFGPRFYDWQLEQTPDESWAESHLHTRNLLGNSAYRRLVDGDRGLVVGEEKTSYQTPIINQQAPATDDVPFQLTGEPKPAKRRR